jgi:ABC-type sugar transport system substrate-binding protein
MFLLTAALVLGITAKNVFAGGQSAGQDGKGKIKIAYVVKAMSDQFWIDMRNGADAAAKEFNVELSFQAPDKETDVERQIQMVENAIIAKVDAIILSAASSTALNPVIVKANKAKIPVILVNDTIDEKALAAEGGFVETYVGIDQYAAAALAGEFCAQNIPGGKVLLLEGPSGVDALAQRLAGFRDKVMGKPGFEIAASQTANCDRNEGFNVTQNVLTARPDVSIIWSVNAEMGQGAIQAIAQAGRSGTISVFDFDASNDDIQAIKAGSLVGSVAQYPEIQARAAIQACIDVLNGKKLAPHTVTKAELITKANL